MNYNPECPSTAGVQQWKGGTLDSCYFDVNSSTTALTVIGQLNASVVAPTPNQILNRNTTVVFNTTVFDDCANSLYDANANWYNTSWSHIATGYNTTWDVPVFYERGPETITVNTTRKPLKYYIALQGNRPPKEYIKLGQFIEKLGFDS